MYGVNIIDHTDYLILFNNNLIKVNRIALYSSGRYSSTLIKNSLEQSQISAKVCDRTLNKLYKTLNNYKINNYFGEQNFKIKLNRKLYRT